MAAQRLPSTIKKLIVTQISQKFRDVVKITQDKMPNPGAGEVIVKNRYVGINASDINYTAGRYDPTVVAPFDCGFEGIGEVAAVGPGSSIPVGQPVIYASFGAFSEYKSVPEKLVTQLPKVSANYLPLQVNGITAAIALDKLGELKSGETVLVTAAAGGTGQFAVQWAKRAGCHVIGTCSSDEKVDFLKKIGCDRPVNYRKENLKQVLKSEYKTGVDVIFESIGGDMFETCFNSLKVKGRLIVIGFITDYQSDLGFKANRVLSTLPVRLLNKSASIRGFFLNHYVRDWRSYITKMAEMIDRNEIQSFVDMGDNYSQGPFIGLNKIVDAVDYLYTQKSIGKIIAEVNKPDTSKL